MPSAADTALSSVDLPPVNLGTLGSPQSPTANDNGLSAVPSPLKQGGKANVGEKLASTDLIAKPPAALQPRPPAAAPPPSSYANRVVAIEGTGQNLLSSSNGTGGFLDPTWLAVTRGEPEVAGKTEQQILQMKVSDPVFATRMVEKYAKKNGDYLQANGLPVNDDTLYLAHFMGAEGARAVLTAPPDTPITAIKDRQGRPIGQIALAANPRLTGMTASSLIDFTASLMSGTHQGQDDPAIQRWQAETRADLDQSKTQFDRIMAEMEKQPPGSAERMQLLHQAMDRSKELADRFDKMSQVPPKPQSPFEAAGALTPLLIGLVSLVGLKSRQPALAAINATGAALGALKQGNDEHYKDAVDLWSKQSQLAYKAFESQNHVIDNIYKDIELNERERQELLQNEFRTWGMNLQHQMAKEGQWPQVYKMHQAAMKLQADLKEQNAKTAESWASARQKTAAADLGGSTNPKIISYMKARQAFIATNQREPSEVEDKKLFDDAQGTHETSEQQFIKGALAQAASKHGVDVEAFLKDFPDEAQEVRKKAGAELKEATSEGAAKGRAAGAPTEFQTIRKDLIEAASAKGPVTSQQMADIDRQVKTFTHQAALSSNKIYDIEMFTDQYGYGLQGIDKIVKQLEAHGFIAGLGGKIRATAEVAGNVVGFSDVSEEKQFRASVQTLRSIANNLIQQHQTGRPLSVQEQRIVDIVPGLELGSTAYNTANTLNDLRELLSQMWIQHYSVIPPDRRGGWEPATAPLDPDVAASYEKRRQAASGAPATTGAAPAVIPPGVIAPTPVTPGDPWGDFR